ncbi:MAG: adenosylcobinamide-phosphate synthase CbiB [Pseudomonadota bacterium]
MELHLAILTLALIVDRLIGDPEWLWDRVAHPVVVFGAAVSFADRIGNGSSKTESIRRRNGMISIALLLMPALVIGGVLSALFAMVGILGWVLEIAVVAILLAQKSLADHVLRVESGLLQTGLTGGREAVSQIVGRDPESLDHSGVGRAAIESLAENFSDGVVAPAFWYALLGLPGILAYKMLNTADSMIGHKNERYLSFGWAAARLDDFANWPAARLSALFIAAAAVVLRGWRAGRRALHSALHDAGLHRSPNAGWPESAMAGALDIALAGPRRYGGTLVREPMLNARGRHAVRPSDIKAAVQLFYASCTALTVAMALLFFAF